jgi:hypothetical protein
MAMSVAVPLSLLEDIFRLLDYLDRLSDRDDLYFHKLRYSHHFEHDTALWELGLKVKQLKSQVVDTYLLTVNGITEDEKHDLWEWVAAGNSVYDNPYSLFNDSGCPMDFINGCRIGIEMAEDPSHFFVIEPDVISNGDWDDELPF